MAATAVTVRTAYPLGLLDLDTIIQALHTTDGATFANDGRTRIVGKNAGAGTHVITVVTPKTIPSGQAIADATFSVLAGDYFYLPFFDPQYFNDPATGLVSVTTDGTKTEISFTAIRES